MLDWLKPILGDGYNEEIDNKIAAEINKGFVAKADYDAAKDAQRTAAEALADANKALAEYKDTDIDGLRKSAEEWQAKAEQAEKDADARVAAVQFDAKLDSAIASPIMRWCRWAEAPPPCWRSPQPVTSAPVWRGSAPGFPGKTPPRWPRCRRTAAICSTPRKLRRPMLQARAAPP